MAQYYFDTSAAVKYYHEETGSSVVAAIFSEPGRRIRISSLGFLEMQSAFALKVRAGLLGIKAARMQRARFLSDIDGGDIEVSILADSHYIAAERLIEKYSFTNRLRTLDSLQLAVALDLAELSLLDQFVVADHPLAEVAKAEGLNVLDPDL